MRLCGATKRRVGMVGHARRGLTRRADRHRTWFAYPSRRRQLRRFVLRWRRDTRYLRSLVWTLLSSLGGPGRAFLPLCGSDRLGGRTHEGHRHLASRTQRPQEPDHREPLPPLADYTHLPPFLVTNSSRWPGGRIAPVTPCQDLRRRWTPWPPQAVRAMRFSRMKGGRYICGYLKKKVQFCRHSSRLHTALSDEARTVGQMSLTL
jgi:hypothetical protein